MQHYFNFNETLKYALIFLCAFIYHFPHTQRDKREPPNPILMNWNWTNFLRYHKQHSFECLISYAVNEMHWKISIKGDNDILNGYTFRYSFDGKQTVNQTNMNMDCTMLVNISSVNLLKIYVWMEWRPIHCRR